MARPAPVVTPPREQACRLPDGREIILSRGRRYRLSDGRDALVIATQITANSRRGANTTVRVVWPTGDGAAAQVDLRLDYFLELVAEELDAPGPSPAAGDAA